MERGCTRVRACVRVCVSVVGLGKNGADGREGLTNPTSSAMIACLDHSSSSACVRAHGLERETC
jgi:hypothetical protein